MDCAAPASTAPAGTDARPSRAAPAGTAPAMSASPMDCAAPASTAPPGTDSRPSRAAPADTAPAGTGARPSCAEAARIIVYLYSKGAIKVQASLFPGLDGGYNMTVTFPEGLASGQQGGQPRPQAQPRPRGAQAENWRRRDPAADPGPKKKPRRRKANVQSSTQCPPAAEPVALAPGHQEGGSNSELKRRSHSATRRRTSARADSDSGCCKKNSYECLPLRPNNDETPIEIHQGLSSQ